MTNSSSRNQPGGVIIDVVDEILSRNLQAASLGIHWQIFGSNGHKTADYSRGVLERFTRRAPKDSMGSSTARGIATNANCWIKNVVNPRKINFFDDPHTINYFEGFYTVDENLNLCRNSFPRPIFADKIVINHYYTKSREEYAKKNRRGDVVKVESYKYHESAFEMHDRNEEFDDGILKYRDERKKIYQPPDKSHAVERLFNALVKNLSPTLIPTTPQDFYRGKMETFLTCRAVSSMLKSKLADDTPAKFFEEASIKAIIKSFNGMSFADARLLIRELPELLNLPYPAVKDLRVATMNIIPQLMNVLHLNNAWKDFVELDYLQRLLKNFKE